MFTNLKQTIIFMKSSITFVSAMKLPFEGVNIILGRARYMRFAWFSALLNLLLYAFILYVLFYFVFPWVNSWFPAHTVSGFMSFLYHALEYIIKTVITLTLLVISIILFNTVFFAISAPYLDGLSLAIEKDFFGFIPDSSGITGFAKSCYISIKNGIRLNVLTIFWAVILFPLNFIIPIIGFLPGMLISSYFLGLSFIIFSSEHRFLSGKEFKEKLSGHRLGVLGFGLIMYLVLFIPFTAILFIPGGIVGGTLLYNEEIEGLNRI